MVWGDPHPPGLPSPAHPHPQNGPGPRGRAGPRCTSPWSPCHHYPVPRRVVVREGPAKGWGGGGGHERRGARPEGHRRAVGPRSPRPRPLPHPPHTQTLGQLQVHRLHGVDLAGLAVAALPHFSEGAFAEDGANLPVLPEGLVPHDQRAAPALAGGACRAGRGHGPRRGGAVCRRMAPRHADALDREGAGVGEGGAGGGGYWRLQLCQWRETVEETEGAAALETRRMEWGGGGFSAPPPP